MDGTLQRREVYGEKRRKNQVEEIWPANLASLGSLARKKTNG